MQHSALTLSPFFRAVSGFEASEKYYVSVIKSLKVSCLSKLCLCLLVAIFLNHENNH